MSFLETISSNGWEVITAIVVANFSAQILKTAYNSITCESLNLTMLFTTGGMPSSHSSSVVAMSTSLGLLEGFDSMYFAMAFCISAVVMYDAAGVRRSAGRQAEVLNKIVHELAGEKHELKKGRLKELLGHSPIEVLAGALWGIAVSLALRYWIVSAGY